MVCWLLFVVVGVVCFCVLFVCCLLVFFVCCLFFVACCLISLTEKTANNAGAISIYKQTHRTKAGGARSRVLN